MKGMSKNAGYNNILFSMDLTIENSIMLQRVVSLCDIFNAKLSVLHVIEESNNDSFEDIEELIGNMVKPFGIPFNSLLIEKGDIQKCLLKGVKEKGIDLIIIGGHGKNGHEEILGSRAQEFLSKARCDVLTLSLLNYKK